MPWEEYGVVFVSLAPPFHLCSFESLISPATDKSSYQILSALSRAWPSNLNLCLFGGQLNTRRPLDERVSGDALETGPPPS